MTSPSPSSSPSLLLWILFTLISVSSTSMGQTEKEFQIYANKHNQRLIKWRKKTRAVIPFACHFEGQVLTVKKSNKQQLMRKSPECQRIANSSDQIKIIFSYVHQVWCWQVRRRRDWARPSKTETCAMRRLNWRPPKWRNFSSRFEWIRRIFGVCKAK